MKALLKFGLYLAWFWLKWTPCFAFYFLGIDGNSAEGLAMDADLERLSALEKAVESELENE